MDGIRVTEAAGRAGWSPRMLRYLERAGLVVPSRTGAGYRLYRLRELNQLRALADLRQRFDLQISDLVFAARLRRDVPLPARHRASHHRARGHDDRGGLDAAARRRRPAR